MSEENMQDSSLYFYEQALFLNRQIGNLSNMSSDLSGMGIALEYLEKYEEALRYLRQSHQVAKKSGVPSDLAFANQHLGYFFLRKKQYDSAKHYMQIAYRYGKEMNYGQLLINSLDVMHKIAFEEKDFERAYKLSQEAYNLGDSLLRLENVSVENALRKEFQIENQALENQSLLEQTQLNAQVISTLAKRNTALVISAVLLIIATIALLTLNETRRRKNKIIQKDRDLIQEQSDRLKELDSFKSTFFANIAHDFRAPISLIRGFIDLMKNNEPNLKDETREYIEHIEQTAERLHNMTVEINQLVLLEDNKYELTYTDLDINDFFGTIGKIFKSESQQGKIEFEYLSDVPEGTLLTADKSALEKIVFNVVGNAFKYNKTGSLVKMRVASDASQLCVTIEDDGPGIQQEKIDKVFERYYRTEKGAKAAAGLGIGLSLVKDLVALHQGEITVSSIPNKNTSFEITLPLSPKPAA